jgi:hypothetical protein
MEADKPAACCLVLGQIAFASLPSRCMHMRPCVDSTQWLCVGVELYVL